MLRFMFVPMNKAKGGPSGNIFLFGTMFPNTVWICVMKCFLKQRAYIASPVEGVLQLENLSKYFGKTQSKKFT